VKIWFAANRTLVELISAGVLFLVIVWLWQRHDTKIAAVATRECEANLSIPKDVADLQVRLDAANLAIIALKSQEIERNELAQIPARAVTRPVWLCPSAAALHTGQAGSSADENKSAVTGTWAAVERPRFDARPSIEQFKVKYETVIAHARAALSQCPGVELEPLPANP
jgi:hypothetical protein